jgi:hypothetical protein
MVESCSELLNNEVVAATPHLCEIAVESLDLIYVLGNSDLVILIACG